MKRIQLFEFEDLSWFPDFFRKPMTKYVAAVHKVMDTSESIAEILAKALKATEETKIIDLCSGSGGPMPEVMKILEEKHGLDSIELSLSDLYPNHEIAQKINNDKIQNINYITSPVNALNLDETQKGLRTMLCSLHHMKPEIAKGILKNAKDAHQPICIYEISDNSIPLWLAWIAIPMGFIMTLFITPLVRPLTWQQIVFTYIIPILPLLIGWDGGVSNMRTYTLSDMDELLEGLHSDNYTWEKGIIKGKGGNKLYLMGLPS